MKKAMFQEELANGIVQCNLCAHRCRIADGRRGICGVRENRDGELFSLVYGRAAALAVDPIEKKPLYHFMPGSMTFSVATKGCNFRCLHCQNCHISQPSADDDFSADRFLEPEQIVRMAIARKCTSVSYTYTEPTIFFEYAYETARIAGKRGLKNIFVTNGYITAEALREIRIYLDAANIDLKSFRDETHLKLTGAELQPVLDAIRLYKKFDIWIEITTLVIPGWNDSEQELKDIAGFIADVGREIPWHVSRFSPCYKLTDSPQTPIETMEKAIAIGRDAGLKHIYPGNVFHELSMVTFCPACGGNVLDRRQPVMLPDEKNELACPTCGCRIEGIWY